MNNTGAYLKQVLGTVAKMGNKAISSDAMFVVDGYEDIRLLTKQFPQPVTSTAGEIEVPGPLGTVTVQPQQLKVYQQGQIQFYETENGDVETFLESLQLNGSKFDATIYEGTMEKYTRAWRISNCFIEVENPDRDWENRSQVLMLSGTLHFHYTGDKLPGNI